MMTHTLRVAAPLLLTLVAAGCGGGSHLNAQARRTHATKATASTADRIATAYAGPKLRAAVGKFDVLPAAQALFEEMGWNGLGALISEQVLTGLVQTNRVAVLERRQIGRVIDNTRLEKEELSEYFDQSTTVESGKLLGVQALLVGAITDFQPNVSGADVQVAMPFLEGLTYHTDKAVVEVEMRLVDAQTGRIIIAASGSGVVNTDEATIKASYKDVKVGTGAFTKTPIGQATRQAADEALDSLVAQLQKTPWEGAVASVDPAGKVYIEAGADLNLKKGDTFLVLRRGEPITNQAGDVLGYQETELCTVQVQAVLAKMSVATVVAGDGVAEAGDRVRLAQP